MGILLSITISVAVTVALLLFTRSRLARQFADIQRRLLQLERSVAVIENRLSHSTTDAQLERLHRGMTRVQESVAQRYGSLVPLAREMSRQGPDRVRFLTDFQLATLEQWAAALSVPLNRAEIGRLLRLVAQAEAGELGGLEIGTTEVLALVIPLLRWRDKRLALRVEGRGVSDLADLLPRLAPAFFAGVEIVSPGESVDAIVAESGDGFDGRSLAEDGWAIIKGGVGDPALPGFRLVAASPRVNVYQRSQ